MKLNFQFKLKIFLLCSIFIHLVCRVKAFQTDFYQFPFQLQDDSYDIIQGQTNIQPQDNKFNSENPDNQYSFQEKDIKTTENQIKQSKQIPDSKSCFSLNKLSFKSQQNQVVIPFQRWNIESKKITGYISNSEIIFFNQCSKDNWRKCETEVYAIQRKAPSKIRKINHVVNEDVEKNEGIFASFNQNFPNQMFRINRGINDEIEIYKLCEKKTNGSEEIQDIGWNRLKIENDQSIKPKFRQEASLIMIKSGNKEAVEGENDVDLMLTGGQSDTTLYNDVWIYSQSKNIWMIANQTGQLDSIKGHSVNALSSSRSSVNQKLFFFGGMQKNSPSNQLFQAELSEKNNQIIIEIKLLEIQEPLPPAREGHQSLLIDQQLIIIGGCDFTKSKCYNDVWAISVDKSPLQWTQLTPMKKSQTFKGREGFGILFDKNLAFVLNGCNANGVCLKESYLMDFKGKCIFQCPKNSKLVGDQCICESGFQGENCSQVTTKKCSSDCNFQGKCVDGKCVCNENRFGNECQFEICLDNCGGSEKGTCIESEMKCQCKKGNYGENCLGNCNKDCSASGYCLNGQCECFEGFYGKSCENREGIVGCWRIGEDSSACFQKVVKNQQKFINGVVFFNDQEYIYQESNSKDVVLEKNKGKEQISEGLLIKYMNDIKKNDKEKDTKISRPVKMVINHDLIVFELVLETGKREILRGQRNTQCNQNRNCFGQGTCDGKGQCICLGKSAFFGKYCQFSSGNTDVNYYQIKNQQQKESYNFNEPEPQKLQGSSDQNNKSIQDSQEESKPVQNSQNSNTQSPEDNSSQQSTISDKNQDNKQINTFQEVQETISSDNSESQRSNNMNSLCEFDQDCQKHGTCVKGKCQCYQGYSGPTCSNEYCPQNCTITVNQEKMDSGVCNIKTQKCECFPGFKGKNCQQLSQCPNNCTSKSHGICLSSGHCDCSPFFQGDDCSLRRCPNNCNNNGVCQLDGTCECNSNSYGIDCGLSCKNNCSKNGFCSNGECLCFKGFKGVDCSQQKQCKNKCSNSGQCIKGECICDKGFEGEFCENTSQCSDNCSDRGRCQQGQCQCDPGFEGLRCEFIVDCPNKCNNRGQCKWGQCYCEPGYAGKDCSLILKCQNGCSQNGVCINGECFCQEGYDGKDCSKKINGKEANKCPLNCQGNGLCLRGKCICNVGFKGISCEQKVDEKEDLCKQGGQGESCGKRGICRQGKCYCYPGFSGQYCQQLQENCPNNCTSSKNGICKQNKCICKPGWDGPSCVKPSKCQNQCSGKGVCFRGTCLCESGYTSSDCSKKGQYIMPTDTLDQLKQLYQSMKDCPNDCSHNGVCDNNECVCNLDWQGFDCSIYNPSTCEDKCNNRGVCKFGRCFCDEGFTGISCQETMKCPNNCNGKGICRHGKCYCFQDYMGQDCSQRRGVKEFFKNSFKEQKSSCLNDCGFKGLCVNSICYCEENWYGLDCTFSEKDRKKQCKFDCNDRGDCVGGRCYCRSGFYGDFCEKKTTFMCQGDGMCNSNGICVAGKCECYPDFAGENCEKKVCSLRSDKGECSNRGFCKNDKCLCEPGYSGPICNLKLNQTGCPNDCNLKGRCIEGLCQCAPGLSQPDCSAPLLRFKQSSDNFSNPQEIFSLSNQQLKQNMCQNGCFGRGQCVNNSCICKEGYSGSDCSIQVTGCQYYGCFNEGKCENNNCICKKNYFGQYCEIEIKDYEEQTINQCENINCGQNGVCQNGKCYCEKGYVSYSQQECRKNLYMRVKSQFQNNNVYLGYLLLMIFVSTFFCIIYKNNKIKNQSKKERNQVNNNGSKNKYEKLQRNYMLFKDEQKGKPQNQLNLNEIKSNIQGKIPKRINK